MGASGSKPRRGISLMIPVAGAALIPLRSALPRQSRAPPAFGRPLRDSGRGQAFLPLATWRIDRVIENGRQRRGIGDCAHGH